MYRIKDLYTLSEKEVIDKILNCEDKYLAHSFKLFQEADKVYSANEMIKDKYCVNVKAKMRYLVPLVKTENGIFRINEVSNIANKQILNYINSSKEGYTYFDFNFIPYE